MDYLALYLTEYTQEIAAGVVDIFKFCSSKGIKWQRLIVHLAVPDQNRFLHLILSEARNLQQFKEVVLRSTRNQAALTNETAIELHAMMSSEQGLERLRLRTMWLLPGALSTLSQGLRANRIGVLEFDQVRIMDREAIADDEIMIDEEKDSEGGGEVSRFIEELRLNKSLEELIFYGTHISDEAVSNLILALVGHPMFQRLTLNGNEGFDQTTRALCSLLDSGCCMLSELTFVGLTFGSQFSAPRKINVGELSEAIVRYGCLQYLDLSHNRLGIRDFATLLDAASRCRTLVTLDVRYNHIGNLNVLDESMQTHTPSRLRRLGLEGNPLGDDDRAALAKLVEDHPELQDFGFHSPNERLLTSDIQYMLDLNCSGRVLLIKPSTPLSVWAKVLERANSLFENDADRDARPERRASVIYALLQGPAFAARLPNN
jgi:hypothetical protein